MMGNYHVRCGAGEKPEVATLEAYLSLFGKILDFKKLISTVRSRGINCQVIVQSVAQLSDRYEKKEWEELVGNCDVQLFLGCNDNMTAEYISGKCGMVTIGLTNNQMPVTPLFSPVLNSTRPYTQTRSNTQRALMLPDETLRLPNDQCIVLLRGQKPLLLHKIIPDELPLFRELVPVKITDYVPEWRKREEQEKAEQEKKQEEKKAQGKVDLHKEDAPPKSENCPPSGSVRYGFEDKTPEPQHKDDTKCDTGYDTTISKNPPISDEYAPYLMDEVSPAEIMGQEYKEEKR